MKAFPSISDKRPVSQSQTMLATLIAACVAAMLIAWSLANGVRPWTSTSPVPVIAGPAVGGGSYALEQTRVGNGFLEVMPNEVTVSRSPAESSTGEIGLREYMPGEVPYRQEPAPAYGLQP